MQTSVSLYKRRHRLNQTNKFFILAHINNNHYRSEIKMNSKCVLFLLSFISITALASAYPQGDESLAELMRSYKEGEDMDPGEETD